MMKLWKEESKGINLVEAIRIPVVKAAKVEICQVVAQIYQTDNMLDLNLKT